MTRPHRPTSPDTKPADAAKRPDADPAGKRGSKSAPRSGNEAQASTPANHEERLGQQIDSREVSPSDLAARDPDALPTRTPTGRGPRR